VFLVVGVPESKSVRGRASDVQRAGVKPRAAHQAEAGLAKSVDFVSTKIHEGERMAVKNKSKTSNKVPKKALSSPDGDGKKYTAFRCPIDLLEKVKLRAKSQRRSLSNYLICLIEEAVK
jgi:ABC-type antimicrobial peptide transport system ATPase subunit